MKIGLLEAFEIDPNIIEIWEKRYGKQLLPVQEKAIRQYPLLQGTSLVVFAPTTSGKTFIGEMLAVTSVRKGKRVFYLVPTKALAEEKFTQFQEMYRSVGISVAISSRDHREWDEAILTKGYDIAILVYEKLQSLLVTRPSLLEEVGVVILDELQMLSDEGRGSTIEVLLTKILQARIRPQLLGLSAVLGRAGDLARWLGAELLIEEKRPVELRKGVFCLGTFFYQEHNSQQEGKEEWKNIEGEDETAIMAPLACYLAGEREESTLLFLKDKPTVEVVARKISEQVDLLEAKEAIEELRTLEETAARDFLIGLLKKGVGIHHADLSWEQRELMERYFRNGSIRILCSTSTLAMGINCPAKNVLIESRQWHYYHHYHGMDTRDLPRSLHENMAGRGGRYGYIHDFGRAILVTHSRFKKKVWMDRYVRGEFEPLEPTLREEEIQEYLLNLVASGQWVTAQELARFFKSTYTAYFRSQQEDDHLERLIEATLEKCLAATLIARMGEGKFTATELGRITALKGIRLATTLALVDWMRQADPKALSDIEILYALSFTGDAQEVYVPLPYRERRGKNYRTWLRREVFQQQEDGKAIFKNVLGPMQMAEAEEARAIKKALMLSEWITPKATAEIETTFELHSGAIRRIGEEYSWLAEAAGAIAKAIGWPEESIDKLTKLSERLIYGVTPQGLYLSRIRLRGLGRTYIARLVKEGYDTPEAIAQLPLDVLQKHLPNRLAQHLYLHLHPEKKEVIQKPLPPPDPQRHVVHEPPAQYPATAAPILCIDPAQQTLSYKGVPVAVSFYPFKFFLALARKPGEVVTKQELYDAVYGSAEGKADDDRPYERQLADHKRRILEQLRKALKRKKAKGSMHEIGTLIAVRRRVGYALNLGRGDIAISK